MPCEEESTACFTLQAYSYVHRFYVLSHFSHVAHQEGSPCNITPSRRYTLIWFSKKLALPSPVRGHKNKRILEVGNEKENTPENSPAKRRRINNVCTANSLLISQGVEDHGSPVRLKRRLGALAPIQANKTGDIIKLVLPFCTQLGSQLLGRGDVSKEKNETRS